MPVTGRAWASAADDAAAHAFVDVLGDTVTIAGSDGHPVQGRFGFTIAGTRVRYYTDDGEDAFVMTTPALSEPAMQEIVGIERERLEGRTG